MLFTNKRHQHTLRNDIANRKGDSKRDRPAKKHSGSQSKRVKLNQVCNAVLYRLMSVTMPPVMNSVKVSCL